MNRVKDKLKTAEQKHKVFKQQQGIFITALQRSRDQALDKTKPVCSVAQVQWYSEDHCNNHTDRRILATFLEIMEDLMEILDILEALGFTGSMMDNCRFLLCPTTDISNLRAQFPDDEVTQKLSCVEARSYYGGVVSLIPMAIDHLRETARAYIVVQKEPEKAQTPKPPPTPESVPQQATDINVEYQSSIQNEQSQTRKPYREMGGKRVWKPPGRTRV
ncbi:sperm acrosome-associated protein 9 [Conger conger]|uniref:sperm acrosome-associated protein 9 n=1 Tax=Conger conger TaxID=82655 RepID=UPI002A5A2ECC|nr:sperm acrosome-associated protein 9 [Conger conger]